MSNSAWRSNNTTGGTVCLKDIEELLSYTDELPNDVFVKHLVTVYRSLLRNNEADKASSGSVNQNKRKQDKTTELSVNFLKNKPIDLAQDVIDITDLISRIVQKLSSILLVYDGNKLIQKQMTNFWKDTNTFFCLQRPNNKIVFELCYKIDLPLLRYIIKLEDKFSSFVKKFLYSSLMSAKEEKFPVGFEDLFHYFIENEYNDEHKMYFSVFIKKLFSAISSYCSRKLNTTQVSRLTTFTNKLPVYYIQLQAKGYHVELYTAAFNDFSRHMNETILAINNKDKSIFDFDNQIFNWSFLFNAASIIKTMTLESSVSSINKDYAFSNLSEGYFSFFSYLLNSLSQNIFLMPYTLNIINLTLALMRATKKSLPIGESLLTQLETLIKLISCKNTLAYQKNYISLLKKLDVMYVIRLNREYGYYFQTHELISQAIQQLLVEYILYLSYNLANLETINMAILNIKRVIKNYSKELSNDQSINSALKLKFTDLATIFENNLKYIRSSANMLKHKGENSMSLDNDFIKQTPLYKIINTVKLVDFPF